MTEPTSELLPAQLGEGRRLSPARRDMLDIFVAAYRLDGSHKGYLNTLLRALCAHVGEPCGAFACLYRALDGTIETLPPVTRELGDDHRSLSSLLGSATHAVFEKLPAPGAHRTECARVSQLLGSTAHRKWREQTGRAIGATDLLLVAICKGGNDELGLLIGLVFRRAKLGRREMNRYGRLARHLADGWRLRRAVGSLRPPSVPAGPPSDEGPAGSESLANLRQLVVSSHAANATDAHASGSAGEAWRNLLDGTWLLVDHFEGPNRHYLVARHAERGRGPRTLTSRERQVIVWVAQGQSDRSIADRLELSASTVATHRSRAMSKLGIRSRALLTQLGRLLDEASCAALGVAI